jgi:2',3'-cyclic-nucleotide 2'-phosphodiesterase
MTPATTSPSTFTRRRRRFPDLHRDTVRILFVGDVVGRPGRTAVEEELSRLRDQLGVDFCIANGENLADGVGITPRLAERLLAAGADAVTLGNHTWRREEIGPYLAASDRVVRPANLSSVMPGRGLAVVAARNGTSVGVVNVLGSLFLEPARSMWEVVDELVDEARRQTPIVVVDVHAEATSEKVALAFWLEGRVTAVLGTHTHVQTSDARILPGGTAAMTDVGMTGPHDSVIGVTAELAIRRMRTGLPVRFETAHGGVRIEGALIDCDAETGRATSIEAVRIEV